MSTYQSRKRWAKQGVQKQSDTFQRAVGFNRYYNDGSKTTTEGNSRKKLNLTSWKRYQKSLEYAIQCVREGDEACREWLRDILFADDEDDEQQDSIIYKNNNEGLMMIMTGNIDMEHDFVYLDGSSVEREFFCNSCDESLSRSSSDARNHYNTIIDEKKQDSDNEGHDSSISSSSERNSRWQRLLLLLWSAYICPDPNDGIILPELTRIQGDIRSLQSRRRKNNDKCDTTNHHYPNIGRRMFVFHVIVSCSSGIVNVNDKHESESESGSKEEVGFAAHQADEEALFDNEMMQRAANLTPRYSSKSFNYDHRHQLELILPSSSSNSVINGMNVAVRKHVVNVHPITPLALVALSAPILFSSSEEATSRRRCPKIKKMDECKKSQKQSEASSSNDIHMNIARIVTDVWLKSSRSSARVPITFLDPSSLPSCSTTNMKCTDTNENSNQNQQVSALLPLHLAVMSGKHWTDGVASLYAAHPHAASTPEPIHCWLPLHCAAKFIFHDGSFAISGYFSSNSNNNNNRCSVIQELVHRRPECAAVMDNSQRLPLHLMCPSSGNNTNTTNEDRTTIMNLLQHKHKYGHENGHQAVYDLIRAYPEAMLAGDGNVDELLKEIQTRMGCRQFSNDGDVLSCSSEKEEILLNGLSTASLVPSPSSPTLSSSAPAAEQAGILVLEKNTKSSSSCSRARESHFDQGRKSSNYENEKEEGEQNTSHSWFQMVRGGGSDDACSNTAEFELATFS